jgi:hypothetical protein
MNELPTITYYFLEWNNDRDQRHRDGDLPAIIWPSGSVEFYKNNRRHRDGDLPASIWSTGRVAYYKKGKPV